MEVLRKELEQIVNWLKESAETLRCYSKPMSNIDRATQIRLKMLEKEGEQILY